jgi:hypothetical protein
MDVLECAFAEAFGDRIAEQALGRRAQKQKLALRVH